ncbi:hypothetical protein [uncultured Roseibium sp.]|uniref:hypothetical protein n=1 Tax=uncultured Roseibium sp. TaxID=1936171 RepID=UPI003216E16B
MAVRYEILVPGSSLAFDGGFFGISSIVLIETGGKRALFDCGHGTTRRMLRERLAGLDLGPGRHRPSDLLTRAFRSRPEPGPVSKGADPDEP